MANGDDRDDDDAWFAALAGKPAPGLDAEQRRRVDVIRAAFAQANRASDGPASAEADQQLQRLLFRMRREGVLKRDTGAQRRWIALAAVLVLGVSVVVMAPDSWLRDAGKGEDTIRGGAGAIVLDAADPDRTVADIAAALRAAGVEATTYRLGIRVGLNASVPADKRAAVGTALKRFGVALPADGELRLEVRAASASK